MPERPKFHGEEPLKQLVRIAAEGHLAELYYRKGATNKGMEARIVEPYSLTQGKQDAMVRCYQREPKQGWRFFMIHKLDRVTDTGQAFEPRAKITLPTGKVKETFEKASGWTTELKWYRNMVGDALADGIITKGELAALEAFKKEHKLTVDQIRFVHASIFHRCLGAILDDGIVDADEVKQIRFLHRVLNRLGWSIGD